MIRDLKSPTNNKNENFLLHEEDDVAGFLGIHFDKIVGDNEKYAKLNLLKQV